ncbi:hypothetical protein BSU04_20065 [Caballeronia sordidicola]|uniref:Uncharacterized protein n=1 Tax=Caballeronia sordidicola TaxID=196367 RepID=A0A226X193_CABSO|nr:hypothetical protein BSU04_20065 [Caballeronia sordidicola]
MVILSATLVNIAYNTTMIRAIGTLTENIRYNLITWPDRVTA